MLKTSKNVDNLLNYAPFQTGKSTGGQEQSFPFRPLSLFHRWQARILVVLHLWPEEPCSGHRSNPHHWPCRSGWSRAQIHRPSKARYVHWKLICINQTKHLIRYVQNLAKKESSCFWNDRFWLISPEPFVLQKYIYHYLHQFLKTFQQQKNFFKLEHKISWFCAIRWFFNKK